jgi:hypothetical protein
MIVHPRKGSTVQVWYVKRAAASMPFHARTGIVRIVSKGPGPRNHGIEIDGRIIGVPCGNIRIPPTKP